MSINTPTKKSRHFSFDVQTAIDYGVSEAILIQNFIFWIEKNLANGRNHHDGRTWTYNTQQAFSILFPFWTYKQIRRVIDSLIKQGILVTGNYNKSPFDRTLWYAFKDENQWLNIPENIPLTLEDVEPPKRADVIAKIEDSHLPKRADVIAQMVEPIPDTTTDLKTDLKPNNNTLDEMPANPTKPIGDILSLSLVGLTEKQKAESSVKLGSLSPVQRDLVIQQFNKTVASGGVKSTPMALLNRLFNLGLENALESPQITKPIPSLRPTPKVPEITLKQRENTRAECLKAFVINKKADLLAEFAQKGFVVSKAFGTIIEPDLKQAGLFD
ncbi:MAG: hypothetical protein LUQ18_09415 [Methylococcaceae bacterium]|nr:hypothetical protein [Methylococcaceae bacterium]